MTALRQPEGNVPCLSIGPTISSSGVINGWGISLILDGIVLFEAIDDYVRVFRRVKTAASLVSFAATFFIQAATSGRIVSLVDGSAGTVVTD